MPVQLLSQEEAAVLRAAPLSYAPIDGGGHVAPPGYRHLTVTRRLKRRDLEGAAHDLLRWRMHERAGLRVLASDVEACPASVVVLRLGVGPVALRIPCRVVEVIDEPSRRGFAYGTLPGHPEAGEERFVLEQETDGTIEFTVTAFSRPASLLARLGGPLSRMVQDWMARRYLAALDRP